MKRIILLYISVLVTGLFASCEQDESLDPRPVQVAGLYARLDITEKVMKDFDPENSYFGGKLTDPSGKIVKYNLYVKRRDGAGFSTEFYFLKEIRSFPTELKVFKADIATALGVDINSIGFGDEYYFYGESFDAAGNRADYYSLSATVQGAPGMKQAYRFRTTPVNLAFYDVAENLNQYDNYVNP